MASGDQDLTLTVKANTGEAQNKLESLGMSIGKMTTAFTLGSIATQAITKAWGFLEGVVSDSISAYMESENAVAQLNSVLESTGHAAGMSAQELINLSKEMQAQTKFSDEAVLSAENLLLTFTNIGKDVFPEATLAVLNMATALKTDTAGAAIQLGKALQDPILGIQALRRVGVNFTEAQQEQIKTLVQTNRTFEAQTLILKELGKEFGGSAVNAAKTFQGQMAQVENQVNDVQEEIGHGLTAAIYNLITSFKEATAGTQGFNDTGKVTFQVMAFVEEAVVNTAVAIWNLGQGVVVLGSYFAQAIDIMYNFGTVNNQFWSDFRSGAADSANASTEFAMNLHQKNSETADSFNQITTDSKAFGQAAKGAYEMTKQAAGEAANKIKEANDQIAATKQKIVDLNEGFLQSGLDTGRAYAEAYVAQEQKVADLSRQVKEAADYQSKSELQLKLNAEIIALQNQAAIKTDLVRDVAEAERRARLTDFERQVEDIARKYEADTKAYLKKAELLTKELKANEEKRDKLAGYEAQTTATAIVENRKRTAVVEQEANNQVAQAQRVANAWGSSYMAASSGNVLNYNMGTVPLGLSKHEFGGVVPGLKGEAQMVLAHGGEKIIPANESLSKSTGGVVVNINYPSVRNDGDLETLRDQIEEVVRPLMLNAKLVHI